MIIIYIYLLSAFIGICLVPIFFGPWILREQCRQKENVYVIEPIYGTEIWHGKFIPDKIIINSKYSPKYILKKYKSKMEMDGYIDEAKSRLKDSGIKMEAKIVWDRYIEGSRSLGGTKSRFYLSIVCESINIDKTDVDNCLQDIKDDFYFLELK